MDLEKWLNAYYCVWNAYEKKEGKSWINEKFYEMCFNNNNMTWWLNNKLCVLFICREKDEYSSQGSTCFKLEVSFIRFKNDIFEIIFKTWN